MVTLPQNFLKGQKCIKSIEAHHQLVEQALVYLLVYRLLGYRVCRDVPTVVGTDHHSNKIATTITQQPLQIHL